MPHLQKLWQPFDEWVGRMPNAYIVNECSYVELDSKLISHLDAVDESIYSELKSEVNEWDWSRTWRWQRNEKWTSLVGAIQSEYESALISFASYWSLIGTPIAIVLCWRKLIHRLFIGGFRLGALKCSWKESIRRSGSKTGRTEQVA